MVHDYVIYNANKDCIDHGGLHYIVSINTIEKESSGREEGWKDYPCSEVFKFRCQDQTLLDFDSGIAWCGISEMQFEESLK